MNKYEKLLNKMHFALGSTLIDNHMCRNGSRGPIYTEEEILRSTKEAYMDLKIMMMRLERELFGEKTYEEDDTEISDRNTGESNDTKNRTSSICSARVGDFSC